MINRVHNYFIHRYVVQIKRGKDWCKIGQGYSLLGDAYFRASSLSLEENNVRIFDSHKVKVVHRFYNGKLLKKS